MRTRFTDKPVAATHRHRVTRSDPKRHQCVTESNPAQGRVDGMMSSPATNVGTRHLKAVLPADQQSAPRTLTTYDDYRRALAAIEHLSERGIGDRVHVAMVDFEQRRVRPESPILSVAQAALSTALIASASTVAALMVINGVTLEGSGFAIGLVVLAVAATTSVLLGLVRGARHGLPIPSHRLVPTRYEVRCDADPTTSSTAAHQLASWWRTGLDGEPATPDGRRLIPQG